MSKNRNGFLAIAIALGLAVIALGISLYVGYEAQKNPPTLSAVVYTTQLSDTIGTFRNEVNSSTANLNTELETVSGTINAYGNIVSQNTPLGVTVGGTGTTTVPSAGQFLSTSGTIPTWKVLASSTGITLTTNATSVIIGTAGFDNTASINFTGNNTFAGSSTFNGNTIINGTGTFNGSAIFNGSTTFAIPPAVNRNYLLYESNANVPDVTNQTTTLFSFSLPANTLGTTNGIEFTADMKTGPSVCASAYAYTVTYGTASVGLNGPATLPSAGLFNQPFTIKGKIFGNSSTTQQWVALQMIGQQMGTSSTNYYASSTIAVNSTAAQTLSLSSHVGNAGCFLSTLYDVVVNAEILGP